MKLPVENIIPLIPQKPPFVMVGKLLFTDDTITRSSFLITADNIFVRNNLFQEAGLLENIAQTAALRAGYIAEKEGLPVAAGYIGAVKNFEIYNLPKTGEEIITEIKIETKVMGITVISGKVWNDERLIVQCEMKVVADNEQI